MMPARTRQPTLQQDADSIARRDFVRAAGAVAMGVAPRLRAATELAFSFQSSWRGNRIWVGKEYWANPLQDWRVEDGEVIAQAAAGRTLHLLTHQVSASGSGFDMETSIRLASPGAGGSAVMQDLGRFRIRYSGRTAGLSTCAGPPWRFCCGRLAW